MKVKTIGWMAALGMILSSVTVWSLTKPKGWQGAKAPESAPETALATGPLTQNTGAQFQVDGPLTLSSRLGHTTLLAGQENDSYVLATVRSQAAGNTRQGLNLSVVLDRSGSMKGRRLRNALDAARSMIRRLSDGDVLSIVAYDTVTDTLLPPTRMDGFSRDRALSAISNVQAKGDTCISCGIDAGMAALRQNSGMVDRILLLSDGEPTSGIKDVAGFRTLATQARSMGCAVSSVGVDVEYNERVLSALALESNGTHYFAETPSDVSRAFDKEIASLSKTTAKNAEVRIALADGVEVEQVVDRAFRREGKDIVVPLGTFSENEEKTVLLRIRATPGNDLTMAVARVNLNYAGPKGSKEQVSGKLQVGLTKDPNLVSPLDAEVEARVTRTESADALVDANRAIAGGDIKGAEQKLQRALADVRRKRKGIASRAPAKSRPKLAEDLDNQEGALNKAAKDLEAAPRPGSAGSERAGKVQQKRNVETSNPMRL